MIVRILPPFTRESALIGELVDVDSHHIHRDTCEGRLLGNSDYIRNNTDGMVALMRSEFEIVNEPIDIGDDEDPYIDEPDDVVDEYDEYEDRDFWHSANDYAYDV